MKFCTFLYLWNFIMKKKVWNCPNNLIYITTQVKHEILKVKTKNERVKENTFLY